ncbi:MAG: hypothetical protein WBB44_08020 [Candidatus Nanopelagicales bacterium]|nr:hypothetical protein [Candidatus Nanopelagicales bacterium]
MANPRRSVVVGSLATCVVSAVSVTTIAAGPSSAATSIAAANVQAAASSQLLTLAPAGSGPAFYESAARYGIRNSTSVRRMQKRLIRHHSATRGLRRAGTTGGYFKATRASVRRWQRKLGYRSGDADGIIGRSSATRLGLRWVPSAKPASTSATRTPAASPPSSSTAQLSPTQLKSVLSRAGFREPSIRIAWAIVMRESRAFPAIVGPKNSDGTRDYGLFQINDVHRSHADFSRILDPVYNAQVGYGLTNGGRDFSHWGIGTQGWAGTLKKQSPKYWQSLQDEMNRWRAQYPG